VDKIFDQFPFGEDGTMFLPPQPTVIDRTDSVMRAGARIAIVTFDNLAEQQRSGDIASVLLLSELWRQGYEVVEPGEVPYPPNCVLSRVARYRQWKYPG
jgi:hypothetical protein